MCDLAGGVTVVVPHGGGAEPELARLAVERVAERYGARERTTMHDQLGRVLPFVRQGRGHPMPADVYVPFDLERIDVEAGLELSFVDDLRRDYLALVLDRPDVVPGLAANPELRLAASPNWALRPAALADPVTEPFTFGQHHATYLSRMGLSNPTSSPATRPIVAVLDNGFDDTYWSGAPTPIPVGTGTDLIPADASTSGHGTLVAAIVADAAPGADVEPIRMGGDESTEWDALHALARAVAIGADIITLSYRQVLVDVPCPRCGLTRHAARSEVFERMLDWTTAAGGQSRAVLVAAGNDGVGVIARPASYPHAIPVTALDTTGASLASFANWDPTGTLGVIALPGDDVAEGTQSKVTFEGTSFATAYAAAMYAEAMIQSSTTWAPAVTHQLCNGAMTVSNAAVPVLT
jgi:Subtilase family